MAVVVRVVVILVLVMALVMVSPMALVVVVTFMRPSVAVGLHDHHLLAGRQKLGDVGQAVGQLQSPFALLERNQVVPRVLFVLVARGVFSREAGLDQKVVRGVAEETWADAADVDWVWQELAGAEVDLWVSAGSQVQFDGRAGDGFGLAARQSDGQCGGDAAIAGRDDLARLLAVLNRGLNHLGLVVVKVDLGHGLGQVQRLEVGRGREQRLLLKNWRLRGFSRAWRRG